MLYGTPEIELGIDVNYWEGTALAVGTLVGFWLLSILLRRVLLPAITRHINGEKHPVLLLLLQGFARPVSALLKVCGLCIGLRIYLAYLNGKTLPGFLSGIAGALPPVLDKTVRVAIILAVAWGLFASSDITGYILRNANGRLDVKMGQSVSHFLSAVFKVVIAGAAVVVLMAEFNYNISGLIAGLGLGSLTVALAAKDSAANFFGGLILITEKPFEIGDWIETSDVSGTVEDISLRSTRIRTSSGALTTIPNARLSDSPISNWGSNMEKRRADFLLSLQYNSNREALKRYLEQVENMLRADEDIIADSVIVRFVHLADSSLDVRVIFFTSQPGFADHLTVRERVNYQLMDLAEQHGLQFAFPTRTLYLNTPTTEEDGNTIVPQ